MRFCFYRGESKINSLYNDTVDRTEVEIRQMHARTTQGGIGVGAKATLGKICEFFGLCSAPKILDHFSLGRC